MSKRTIRTRVYFNDICCPHCRCQSFICISGSNSLTKFKCNSCNQVLSNLNFITVKSNTEKEWKEFRDSCKFSYTEFDTKYCKEIRDKIAFLSCWCDLTRCPLIKDFLKKKTNLIDEQFIFKATCWKCWLELTNTTFHNVVFPFKILTKSIKDRGMGIFDAFLLFNGIKKAGMHRDMYITYRCPNCNHNNWKCNAVYYPYLYLYIQEIKKGLR